MNLKTLLFFVFIAISAMLVLAAVSIPKSLGLDIVKLVLLIIAMLFDVLAFASRFYMYLMIPMLEQRTNSVVLSNADAYWFSTSMDSIIAKQGDDFIATVYISIPLYRSATEMSEEDKINFSMQVSRLVGLSKDPARYTTEMFVMNKDAYIQTLRDRISDVETRESEIMQKTDKGLSLERVRGELSMWRNILDKTTNTQSFELGSYVTVSARGAKEFEAVSTAQQRAREMISGIGAIFGVSPIIVTGQDILKYVEPEYLIPFSTVSEQLSRKIEESVI
ncbi:MAG: hypothetical protein M1331_01315 [Candidatus Marsarchaeota archaeon]|nr:hypothetical protein [Candidatus Marsarchaeota archaeon]MCL5106021.1 hypothetical protein [Candidatus Marsarchaeota archaeon]